MRTIVDIPEADLAPLDEFCRRQNISRAEAVRRAVRGLLERTRPLPPDDEAFGLWAAEVDGVDYQHRLREEW